MCRAWPDVPAARVGSWETDRLRLGNCVDHDFVVAREFIEVRKCRAPCRLDTFALQDAFIHNYGSHGELLAAHGLTADTIWTKVAA